jgi:hypothetical protein
MDFKLLLQAREKHWPPSFTSKIERRAFPSDDHPVAISSQRVCSNLRQYVKGQPFREDNQPATHLETGGRSVLVKRVF